MKELIFFVTTFGYTVSLSVILSLIAVVVGSLLFTSFLLTIGLSLYRFIKQKRQDRIQPKLRTELLDRLFTDAPQWDEWVEELTAVERNVAESLLDEHLRELDGSDADTLQELGNALGIPARAARQLETGDEYTRLRALTWLTLLKQPQPCIDSSFEPKTPRERASVVTLLEETDQLPDAATGISTLLDGIDEPFSVFGQDTLYRIARLEPEPLLQTASEAYNEWPEPLLGQVLDVCIHLETSVRDGELAWLIAVLETGSGATRAGAARALASFGWQAALREQAFLERAINDPSPQVRTAVYEMLASWGDEAALNALYIALIGEDNPRTLTAGTTALVEYRDRLDANPEVWLGDAWVWSLEHEAYDRRARQTHHQEGQT